MMTQNYETPTSATHIHGIYTTPPLPEIKPVLYHSPKLEEPSRCPACGGQLIVFYDYCTIGCYEVKRYRCISGKSTGCLW